MIYIDIDETVRDLLTPIKEQYGIEPTEWCGWDTKIYGKGFCSFITKDISLNAPLTEFGEHLSSSFFGFMYSKHGHQIFWNGHEVRFLTGAIHRDETVEWMNRNFQTPLRACSSLIFVKDTAEKYKYLKDCDWFVDDCPKFIAYPDLKWKWICIPQPYNYGVTCYSRTDDIREIAKIVKYKSNKLTDMENAEKSIHQVSETVW